MSKERFATYSDWHLAATSRGYAVESWGICGSKNAHNVNGQVVGTWYAKFDTCNGISHGELNQSDVDVAS